MQIKDMTGLQFGRVTVTKQDGFNKKGQARWLCSCSCGKSITVDGWNLRAGITVSCGCFRRDTSKRRMTTHGKSRTLTHNTWHRMRQRCNNPKSTQFKWYGGRGIKICERWDSFELFFLDMGERQKGYTIDRINNDGDYEPSNCRWILASEQKNNTAKSHFLTFDGKTQTIRDWGRETGIAPSTILRRITTYGWSLPDALTKPVKEKTP